MIVVSYNTCELTLAALRSAVTTWSDLQLIVVDNASGDGSGDRVAEEFGEAALIRNDTNVGFARAVNAGLTTATGDYVLLLNPDCVLEHDTLSTLVEYLTDHADVGAVAPMIVHPDDRLSVLSAGFEPTASAVLFHYSGLSRLRDRLPALKGWHIIRGVDDGDAVDVDWVSGACMLIPRRVIARVGPLSERWFMYAEDIDYCHRIRAASWRVVHLPRARASHLVGAASQGKRGGPVNTMWVESLADYYDEVLSPGPWHSRAWRASMASGLLARAILYSLRGAGPGTGSDAWTNEARRFRVYAKAALAARPRSAAGA